MSFRDGTLYSYSTAIAAFREHKGKPYLVFNNTSYSVTTQRHQSLARLAAGHISPAFLIAGIDRGSSLDFGPKMGLKLYECAMEQAATLQAKSAKARQNKAGYLDSSRHWLSEAQRISDFFGLRKKVDDKVIARLVKEKEKAEKQYAAEMKAAKERRKIEREARLAETKVKLEEWVNGINRREWLFNDLPVRLRASGSDEEHVIETSHGVTIPYEEGRKCFEFYLKHREKGWKANGRQFDVGPYKLLSVSVDGITAGCHVISHGSIMELAAKEGWV